MAKQTQFKSGVTEEIQRKALARNEIIHIIYVMYITSNVYDVPSLHYKNMHSAFFLSQKNISNFLPRSKLEPEKPRSTAFRYPLPFGFTSTSCRVTSATRLCEMRKWSHWVVGGLQVETDSTKSIVLKIIHVQLRSRIKNATKLHRFHRMSGCQQI